MGTGFRGPSSPEPLVADGYTKEGLITDMAERYAKASGCDDATARDAAEATWGTEWENDPAPRDREGAFVEVDGDLEYWEDE